jgi:hypothetical protein
LRARGPPDRGPFIGSSAPLPKLSHLLSLTPLESWRIIRLRLPLLRSGPAWRPSELLSSAKHSRGIRFAELQLRQEALVRGVMPWQPLDYEGKRVVEVGCGPLAGFGPLAVFRGAASFESAEPEWDPNLFFSEPVMERYLRVFHADLVALYGPRMDFTAFQNSLRTRMSIHRSGFDRAPIGGGVDVVLSQSCLEHVFPLEATVEKLAAIQAPQARFLHLVDFGNHYPTGNPFEGLYEQPPADYIARRGKALNLLRVSDISALFARFGIAAKTVPARVLLDGYRGKPHAWWRECYDDAALFTQLALVTSPA